MLQKLRHTASRGSRHILAFLHLSTSRNGLTHFLFQAKESWELEGPEKLEQSELLKTKGTNFFKV